MTHPDTPRPPMSETVKPLPTRDEWAKIIYDAMSASLDEKITWEQVQEAAKKQPWQAKSMQFIYDIVDAVMARAEKAERDLAQSREQNEAIRKSAIKTYEDCDGAEFHYCAFCTGASGDDFPVSVPIVHKHDCLLAPPTTGSAP